MEKSVARYEAGVKTREEEEEDDEEDALHRGGYFRQDPSNRETRRDLLSERAERKKEKERERASKARRYRDSRVIGQSRIRHWTNRRIHERMDESLGCRSVGGKSGKWITEGEKKRKRTARKRQAERIRRISARR